MQGLFIGCGLCKLRLWQYAWAQLSSPQSPGKASRDLKDWRRDLKDWRKGKHLQNYSTFTSPQQNLQQLEYKLFMIKTWTLGSFIMVTLWIKIQKWYRAEAQASVKKFDRELTLLSIIGLSGNTLGVSPLLTDELTFKINLYRRVTVYTHVPHNDV